MKRFLLLPLLLVACQMQAQTITPQAKERAAELVAKMTLEEKIDYIGGHNKFYIMGIPRLGIPEIRMADGPQGVRNETRSTMYACGVAAAATWNRDVVFNMGVGLGQDSRARGVHILLGPGVNIYRSPLCGRNFEYFGEDPYLASETAIQYIKGLQSQEVMATIKHFAGNNQEYGRHHVSSDIDERTLQEIYYPAFRRAIHDAQVGAVMSSYNPLNGVHTTENRDLIIETLRRQWGFEGIFMSDWNATYSAVGPANNGLDLEMPFGRFMNREYLLPAIQNGLVKEETIDEKVQHILQTLISFGFFDRPQQESSIPELNEFSNMAALDLARESAVLLKNDNILPLKKGRVLVTGPCADTIYTGGGSGFVHPFYTVSVIDGMKQMGKPYKVDSYVSQIDYDLDAADFYAAAGSSQKGLTAEYFTNMNFEGKPALIRTETKVCYDWVKGSPAPGIPEDGFSVRWSGVLRPSEDQTLRLNVGGDDGYRLFIDDEYVTGDWANHRATFREVQMDFKAGRQYKIVFEYYDHKSNAEAYIGYELLDKQAHAKAVKSAEAVIVCVGFSSSTEKENSDRTFGLPEGQDELILETAALNPNVVVVVNSGGGVDMSPWHDKVKGIIMAWYPGQEGGLAIAEILTGKISPSGKLPISIEKRWEDNPVYDSYYPNLKNEYRGQTYERVSYNEGVFVGYRGYDRTGIAPRFPFGFGLSYTTFSYSGLDIAESADGYDVSFDIRNTGKMAGSEVVQLYVTDSEASVPRPQKELKGFDKVYLRKGESRRITIHLEREAFAYYDTSEGCFVVEPGQFIISVGPSSADLPLKKSIHIM